MKKKILTIMLSVTTFFSAMGFSACEKSSLEIKMDELEAQLTTLQTQNKDLQNNITEQQEQIANLGQDNQGLKTQIETLEGALAKYDGIIVEESVSNMIELWNWSVAASSAENCIGLYSPIENVVFECVQLDGGWDRKGTVQKNLRTNEWTQWVDFDREFYKGEGLTDYVDIYLNLDGNYIGYAVIQIKSGIIRVYPTVLKSVIFSKLGGEYQQVSREEVENLVAQTKEKAEGKDSYEKN